MKIILLLGLVAGPGTAVKVALIGGVDDSHTVKFFQSDGTQEESKNPILLPKGRGRVHGAGVYLGMDTMLLAGGEGVDDSTEKSLASADLLNLRTGTLNPTKEMREFRSSPAATMAGGLAYVCGGLEGHLEKQCSLNSCEVFNSREKVWNYIAPMKAKRGEFTLTTHGGYVYAMGGNVEWQGDCMSPKYHVLDSAERYNPGIDRWEEITKMPKSRYAHGAAAYGKYIYVCGGHSDDGDDSAILKSCDRFDTESETWEANVSNMQFPRQTFKMVTIGDRIYAIGGSSKTTQDDEDSRVPRSVEYLDLGFAPQRKKLVWKRVDGLLPMKVYGSIVSAWWESGASDPEGGRTPAPSPVVPDGSKPTSEPDAAASVVTCLGTVLLGLVAVMVF